MTRLHVQAAKRVIITVVCELFAGDTSAANIDRTLNDYDRSRHFADIDDFEEHYLARKGMFLVLLEGDEVVGTGAVRPLDQTTAELKRMWFLPEYRGLGLGRSMAEQLLEFARTSGYTHVRLDSGKNQVAALRLYHKLGFREIQRYNESTCDVFMELEL
ncbi:MAG: GNAT family N-acetyltransferase [Candidatus Sumerlaeaceae bacterium]